MVSLRNLFSRRPRLPAPPETLRAQLALTDTGVDPLSDRLGRIAARTAIRNRTHRTPVDDAGWRSAEPDPATALARASTQAIVFRQHIPPRPEANSHWGGLPKLPAHVDWPRYRTAQGEMRPLSFLLQIDCAELPVEGRLGLMPSWGLLLFFVEMEWGKDWQWRVIHVDATPDTLAVAKPPADLPRLYGDRGGWSWMQNDDAWPRRLPRFSFDPVLIKGRFAAPPANDDEAQERKLWPGAIDLKSELEAMDGGIVDTRHLEGRYDGAGGMIRPFANFPHDWRAVTIAMGHLSRHLDRGHLGNYVKRGKLTQDQANLYLAQARSQVEQWSARAAEHPPFVPLSQTDSDAVWNLYVKFQAVSLYGLSQAAHDALDATLAGSANPAAVLSPEALELAKARHALARHGSLGLHLVTPDRMLAPPSCPQVEASERADDWLLLLEMSSDDAIGHHFGDGVFQFWIRPEDLRAGRFDRVELTGEAY